MKHVPNILTFIRLLLIPVYFMVFYSEAEHALLLALAIFVVASITDVLDGFLARKYQVVSKFGTVADPFADKMMQVSVLYSLSDISMLEKWFFWIILVKELCQILLGIIMVSIKPKMIMSANIFGKTTTVLVFVTIIFAVLSLPGATIIQFITAVLAIITFTQYAYHFLMGLKERKLANK